MIQVSDAIRQALAQDSRTFMARLLVDGVNVNGNIRALNIYKGSCGADEFNLGVVYCPYITAVIDYEGQAFDDLNGKETLVQIGINLGTLDDPEFDYINIGNFTVLKPQAQGSLLYITAQGRLSTRFNGIYTYEGEQTLQQVLTTIQSATGVPIFTKGSPDLTGTVSGLNGWKYIEVLQIIAGLVGGYVTEDNAGGVVLATYGAYSSGNNHLLNINGTTIAVPEYTATGSDGTLSLSSDEWQMSSVTGGVSITFGSIDVNPAEIYEASPTDFKTLPTLLDKQSVLDGITCFKSIAVDDEVAERFTYGDGWYQYANEYMTQALFDKMTAVVGGFSHRAGNMELAHGIPTLEPWDAVAVTMAGVRYVVPCMSIEIIYDGGIQCRVASAGKTKEEAETQFQGVLSQRVARTVTMAKEAQETADTALETAETAKGIADNTDQYFWHTQTGTDTGAHITEIPKDEFLEDPSNGGGNLLMRSNGMAVRDGLDELAKFTADGSQIGQDGQERTAFSKRGFEEIDREGNVFAEIKDLRDDNNVYPITDTFTGDGSERAFNLSFNANGTDYEVTVSDGSGGNIDKRVYAVIFEEPPSDGAIITVTYDSNDERLKFYTFGIRKAGTDEGAMSFAEGYDTEASGFISHAEGYETKATGKGSHAEGESSEANGYHSHAEGHYARANGASSHAEGGWTYANGHYSHAEGQGTIAGSLFQHVQGTFNVEDSNDVYADIVGKGSSSASRKNIEATTWTGDKRMKGDVYVNCNDDSTGGNKVLSIANVDGNVITVNNVTVGYTNYNVAFNKTFTSNPYVVAGMAGVITAQEMGRVSVACYGVTTTGCTIRIYNDSGATRNVTFRYIAIGI